MKITGNKTPDRSCQHIQPHVPRQNARKQPCGKSETRIGVFVGGYGDIGKENGNNVRRDIEERYARHDEHLHHGGEEEKEEREVDFICHKVDV